MAEEKQVVRDITEEEIRTFHEKGWVFVKKLVDCDVAADMLAFARERMIAEDQAQLDPGKITSVKNWWWELSDVAREEDMFAGVAFGRAMGRNFQRLFRRDVSIRYIGDCLMVKAPAADRNACGPTSWHQDIPSFPFDRSGTMSCWLALDHLTPEMGTMHFLEGSHKGELFGRILGAEDPNVIPKKYPHVFEDYQEVESPTFEPGDATFHHCQIVHGAPANTSDRMRWSYTMGCFAADSLYTGASCYYTDGLNLPVEQPITDPRFPEICSASV